MNAGLIFLMLRAASGTQRSGAARLGGCARWVVLLAFVVGACGGGADRDERAANRLPYMGAPLDTLQAASEVIEARADTATLSAPPDMPVEAWPPLPVDRRIPLLQALTFSRYENARYRYSLLYPDSLFKPQEDVGDGRGMEFGSDVSTAAMIVYAEEAPGPERFEERYLEAVEEPGMRITYRVRGKDWYIISGYVEERAFYEKAVYREPFLQTFRMQYPREEEAYFDAVAATIASDF